jgi:hypothetical protein
VCPIHFAFFAKWVGKQESLLNKNGENPLASFLPLRHPNPIRRFV